MKEPLLQGDAGTERIRHGFPYDASRRLRPVAGLLLVFAALGADWPRRCYQLQERTKLVVTSHGSIYKVQPFSCALPGRT